LDGHRKLKKAIYMRYKDGLQDFPLTMNPYLSYSEPNFWLSCILLDASVGITPIDLMNRLNDENIEARPIWKPMHMQPVFKDHDFVSVNGDVGRDIFERGLCLPSDIKMTEQEQERVIHIIKSMF